MTLKRPLLSSAILVDAFVLPENIDAAEGLETDTTTAGIHVGMRQLVPLKGSWMTENAGAMTAGQEA